MTVSAFQAFISPGSPVVQRKLPVSNSSPQHVLAQHNTQMSPRTNFSNQLSSAQDLMVSRTLAFWVPVGPTSHQALCPRSRQLQTPPNTSPYYLTKTARKSLAIATKVNTITIIVINILPWRCGIPILCTINFSRMKQDNAAMHRSSCQISV